MILRLIKVILRRHIEKMPRKAIIITQNGLSDYEAYVQNEQNKKALADYERELYSYLHIKMILEDMLVIYRDTVIQYRLRLLQTAIAFYREELKKRKEAKIFNADESEEFSPKAIFHMLQQVLEQELKRRKRLRYANTALEEDGIKIK